MDYDTLIEVRRRLRKERDEKLENGEEAESYGVQCAINVVTAAIVEQLEKIEKDIIAEIMEENENE